MKKIILLYFAVLCHLSFQAAVFTVTNTNNSGTGSLRQAIDMANSTTGPHSILFNIPLTDPNYDASKGVWKITTSSSFNYITRSDITIDGSSQTTNQGNTNPNGPEIQIDGNNNTVNYCFGIMNASNITIKDLIISRFMIGIQIYGNTSQNNIIIGNYIGTNYNATDTAGNYIGIELIQGTHHNRIGGSIVEERNIVSGNLHIGIRIVDAHYNQVIGNYVGINRLGTAALKNYDGISIEGFAKFNTVGGLTSGERNIVSGNMAYGIPAFGAGVSDNIIIGNYVGTDVSGTHAIPNTYGVLFDDGSHNNTLGGSTPAHRNILSGNSGYGVFIYNMGTHSNIVQGNYIGTDVTGLNAIPNAIGVVVDGAAYKHTIDNNIISANLQEGIYIHITGCDSTLVTRNKIGTNALGNSLGNGQDGIRISEGPKHSIIGGSATMGNEIAFNNGAGISIISGNDISHEITYNSIYKNAGLGIDLFPFGPNINDNGDMDNGPNHMMNYPIIDTLFNALEAGKIVIKGRLDTQNPELCMIHLYLSDLDPSGYGEGKQFLSLVIPDSFGNWSDTLQGITLLDFITATATNQFKSTSEFSMSRNSYVLSITPIAKAIEILEVYPNPNDGNFQINTKNAGLLNVFDQMGVLVFQQTINETNTALKINLTSGIYTLSFKTKNGTITNKMVVHR